MSNAYKAGHWQRGLVSKEVAERVGTVVKHIQIVDGKEVVVGTTIVDPTMVAKARRSSGDPIGAERNPLVLTAAQIARNERMKDRRAAKAAKKNKPTRKAGRKTGSRWADKTWAKYSARETSKHE